MKTISELKAELKKTIQDRMRNAKTREEVLTIWNEDRRIGIPKEAKRLFCSGCRQNFYNGHNEYGINECWSLSSGKLKKRKIYSSLNSTKPDEVTTLSCFIKEYH